MTYGIVPSSIILDCTVTVILYFPNTSPIYVSSGKVLWIRTYVTSDMNTSIHCLLFCTTYHRTITTGQPCSIDLSNLDQIGQAKQLPLKWSCNTYFSTHFLHRTLSTISVVQVRLLFNLMETMSLTIYNTSLVTDT